MSRGVEGGGEELEDISGSGVKKTGRKTKGKMTLEPLGQSSKTNNDGKWTHFHSPNISSSLSNTCDAIKCQVGETQNPSSGNVVSAY